MTRSPPDPTANSRRRAIRVEIGNDGLNVRLRMDGLAGLAREITADIGAAA